MREVIWRWCLAWLRWRAKAVHHADPHARSKKKAVDALARRMARWFGSLTLAQFAHDGLSYALLLDPRDVIGRESLVYGLHAPERFIVLTKFIAHGDVIIDAGANTGTLTVPLALMVGIRGTVHAYEPHPRARMLLEQNLALNQLGNVVVHPEALGAFDGQGTLYSTKGDRAHASLKNVANDGSGIPISVKVYDRDPIRGRIAFVKIDVEGSEHSVMSGMREMIARDKPVVLVRIISRLYYQGSDAQTQRAAVIRFFEQLSYTCMLLTSQGLVPLPTDEFIQNGLRSVDIVALPKHIS